MWRLEVITEWVVINGRNVAKVIADGYSGSFTDVTGQATPPTTPNAVIFECEVDDATADLMEADNDLYILSAEEIVVSEPESVILIPNVGRLSNDTSNIQ